MCLHFVQQDLNPNPEQFSGFPSETKTTILNIFWNIECWIMQNHYCTYFELYSMGQNCWVCPNPRNNGGAAGLHHGWDTSPSQGTIHTQIHTYGQFILVNPPTGILCGHEQNIHRNSTQTVT